MTCNGIVGQYGAFQEKLRTRQQKIQGFDVAFVTCQFERGTLDLQVTYDDAKQVSGFLIRPSQSR